ncbi:hypothetical protein ACLF3G_28935 [Falsiroseomonas sp. HC035]|uniref:hypothetical protein n=1 Tax=Falsiroseomonas sp. HC035 TaxID=3390999 RepID=UPI003D31B927
MSSNNTIADDLRVFIRSTITSIWSLELLLFLKKQQDSAWSTDQLVRELRGSNFLVQELVLSLCRAGLINEDETGAVRYSPSSPKLATLVERLEQLTLERPMAVRNAIVAAPHDKIQVFADAFKVKKDQA